MGSDHGAGFRRQQLRQAKEEEEERERRRQIVVVRHDPLTKPTEKWEYGVVLVRRNSAIEIDKILQGRANEGWRLHPVSFGLRNKGRILVFERENSTK